ncbi:MAG: hypothetical protein A2289_04305 [Deltaproteobacteria bacterium RIFOXYA12_FULL_58_15]|nr:MAG: hypothetical protein A2289_04305 [Deltaproteobacteria bacterium RIFOXYA12_FULL_58_15]OGR11621.1 MAG: hypothetical protein A2341_02695 [Deltaproteobacteria bacterium RIFOXYB12_FULL_58_9]
MKGPRWPLEQVKSLAANGQLFLQRTRALDLFESPKAAYVFARETIETLTEKNFVESKQHIFDVMDIYGVHVEDQGWYLKLYVDEEVPEVTVVSLHPLERAIKTRGGMVKL